MISSESSEMMSSVGGGTAGCSPKGAGSAEQDWRAASLRGPHGLSASSSVAGPSAVSPLLPSLSSLPGQVARKGGEQGWLGVAGAQVFLAGAAAARL